MHGIFLFPSSKNVLYVCFFFSCRHMYLGDEEIVKLLIENGADLNIPNVSGETPLFNAAHKGKSLNFLQSLVLRSRC